MFALLWKSDTRCEVLFFYIQPLAALIRLIIICRRRMLI